MKRCSAQRKTAGVVIQNDMINEDGAEGIEQKPVNRKLGMENGEE